MTRLRTHTAFVFWGGRGGIQKKNSLVPNVFPSYSHEVPAPFPKGSPSSQFVPNSTSTLSHTKLHSHVQTEKLESIFDSISRLGVRRDVSIGECPMFQKIGDRSINLAPSKLFLPFVSVCHYLLQFLEPLIRMVHHGIDKDSRQLIERVHTFPPPPLASLVRPPWASHYKSKLHTPPFQLQSSPDSSSYTAFLAYQTPSSYTSVAGSIVFCLPGVKNIRQLRSICSSLPNKHSST
jgi:hypothetical protein